MYFGAAYYPEHWPEERWVLDAHLMSSAGINGVRMGEFAWSKIEPTEGQYDFSWMDRAVELLGTYQIKTMMCTFSRTPPPWVYRKYPEIRNVNADRHAYNYGHRYAICLNNPTFIDLSQQIDQMMIRHYAGHPDIIGWHIDNEIGSRNTCYCKICHSKFHEYLKLKYQTIDNLNACWGTHFWSFAFSSFDEVPLPVGVPIAYPGLTLEYARFQSEVNSKWALWRYKLIKEIHPEVWVTTNFQTSNATHTDIFELGNATDIYGTNFYPPFAPEFALDYCRGKRNQLLILEQRSGQPHFFPAAKPGWVRLWTYHSIAHGATGINFFRWRTCRWGHEEYWHGILPHSGRTNRRYREIKQTGLELKNIAAEIEATKPNAKAAIIMNYDSRWALDAVTSRKESQSLFGLAGFGVHDAAQMYHAALMKMNVVVDAMDPKEDLSNYKLVIAPRLYLIDPDTATNLKSFVRNGGILCLTPRSGVVDEYNVIFDQPSPGPLSETAGIEVDDYTTIDHSVKIHLSKTETPKVDLLKPLSGIMWADEITTTTAKPVAQFSETWLAGQPAITLNHYGKGSVIYIGTILDDTSILTFVRWLIALSDINPVLTTPEGVQALERICESYRLIFLLNFTDEEHVINLPSPMDELLNGIKTHEVQIKPGDLAILKTQ